MRWYLLRHGHSPSAAAAGVATDFDRPLSDGGRDAVRKVARLLASVLPLNDRSREHAEYAYRDVHVKYGLPAEVVYEVPPDQGPEGNRRRRRY